jgi:hypothetical protein
VYTSVNLPIDYMFSDTAIDDPEYKKSVHTLSIQHYIERAGFAALTGYLADTLQIPTNIRHRKSHYAIFCVRGIGLSLLENIPDTSKSDSIVVVGNFSALLELNPSLELYPGFAEENCKVVWGPTSDMAKLIRTLPIPKTDSAGKERWMARPYEVVDLVLQGGLGFPQDWHIFIGSGSWIMREMKREEQILGSWPELVK